MNKLPIKSTKLNIFKKIKLKFYQSREYGSWYYKVPDYIKQDEKIIKKRIKFILKTSGEHFNSIQVRNITEIFMSNPELFDNDDRNKIMEILTNYINGDMGLYNNILICITNLNVEEQVQMINAIGPTYTYKFISLETAKYLISINKFNTSYFSNCSLDIQVELMKENKEFILQGSLEAQTKYLKENPQDFEFASNDGKIRFLIKNPQHVAQHPEYVKELPKETQMLFATEDSNNIKFLKEEYQKEIISNHPNAFTYITSDMKRKIFDDKENIFLIKRVVDADFKNFKYLLNDYDNSNNFYLRNVDVCNQYFENISGEINGYTSEKLENIFLKSGIIYARGTLRNYGYSYQDNGYDPKEETIDIYRNEELNLIQNLSPEQITELIKIDSNYILAYVENPNIRNNYGKRIDSENEVHYRQKCKEVFKNLFGDENLEIYEECIDNIFKKAVGFEDRDINNRKNIKDRQTQFPLESLKLLFNEKILNSNDPEKIKEYYAKLLNGEDVRNLFLEIIGNAYGEKALQILKDRPGLDLYSINSLEIFDERILDNFSPAFVNDLLSYNIVGISSFFNIVKNDDDLKAFKKYYSLLSKVFGENIETMQKAISEYYYIDELFKNIDIDKLNDEQYANLICCICGNRNEFGISTLEELDQFDEIANKQLIDEISIADKGKYIERREYLKQKIFSNFFGLNVVRKFELVEGLTEEETRIIECINLIYEEESIEKIKEIMLCLLKNTNIRNPIALHTAINKIKEKTRIEPLRARLLLKDDLDIACENSESQGKIRKEQCDNITIYYLTGIDLTKKKVLEHNTGNANGRDLMESESQLGMSTVSTYYTNIDSEQGEFLFTDIETEDLIGVNYQDSGTSHVPRVVRASRCRRK